ncbi:MAG: hypothetical protein NC078_03870 [Ruminococcus sp.]|nr:hypothetical protein [Ruminococcus sp.]
MAQNDVLVYKFEQLRSCSAKIGNVADVLDELKEMSVTVRDRVHDYWQGEAADIFIGRLGDLSGAVDELSRQVGKSREILDKAIEKETENEENLRKDTVGRLSADNIF